MPEPHDYADKLKERVTIFLSSTKVIGEIYRYPRVRFSDEWNREHREFIPITNCMVLDRITGDVVEEVDFLLVRKEQIDLIFPEEGSPQMLGEEEEAEEHREPKGDLRRLTRLRSTQR